MNTTLYQLSNWQQNTPSLADRYHLKREIDWETLKAHQDINTDFFIQLISLFHSESELPIEQLKSFPLSVILDYLEKTHRYYTHTKLLEIEQSLFNLQRNRAENTLLPFLLSFFEWIKENLNFHIQMEEEQLFPYIKALTKGSTEPQGFTLQSFVDHHVDTVELQLSEVKKHIVRAQSSAEDIFPFRVLLKQLDDFERDLRIHAKIEDEVLIPLAKIVENQKAFRQ